MSSCHQIPFGLHSSGRMITPQEASNGLSCDCTCSGCGAPLIARQGKEIAWCFAHAPGSDCAGAIESSIHRMAKQMIIDRKAVYHPKLKINVFAGSSISFYQDDGFTYRGKKIDIDSAVDTRGNIEIESESLLEFDSCEAEVRMAMPNGVRQPDILADIGGTKIAVEVAFTHFCDDAKKQWMHDNDLFCIEVDINILKELSLGIPAMEALESRLFTDRTHKNISTWIYYHMDDEQKQFVLGVIAKIKIAKEKIDFVVEQELLQKKQEWRPRSGINKKSDREQIRKWVKPFNGDATFQFNGDNGREYQILIVKSYCGNYCIIKNSSLRQRLLNSKISRQLNCIIANFGNRLPDSNHFQVPLCKYQDMATDIIKLMLDFNSTPSTVHLNDTDNTYYNCKEILDYQQ